MEKLLWIGDPYFAKALPDCGWSEACIYRPSKPDVSWEKLTSAVSFAPDVVVVVANGDFPPLVGMEDFPCMTVFYSAAFQDWHIPYAQGFDAAIVSSFDKMDGFNAGILKEENIWWSPPFASENARPDPEARQKWDCLFLADADNKDCSKSFTDQIAAGLDDFHMRLGNASKHSSKARILLQHTGKDELGAEVFDALGRGCCLVTPRVKDGLGKIFVDGEQLVAYAPGDAGDALYRIRFLLDRPELRAHIAAQGYEEINAFHRAIHRAQALTDHLFEIYMAGPEMLVQSRLENASLIRQKFLNDMYQDISQKIGQGVLRDIFVDAIQ